jgi:type VI secretion system protein VasD
MARAISPVFIRRALVCVLLGVSASVMPLMLGVGCSSPPPVEAPKPCDKQIVTLDLYAAGNVNPNENGNPRPVVIRLYQLQSEINMTNARYDDVLLKRDEALAVDVMKVDEVTVFPNDHLQVKFERIKEASHLAGVALVHGPKGQSWKTFYEFPPAPGDVQCGGRAEDAGAGVADPRTAFFLESSKIDNGSQFDESMFPNARPVKKISLSKRGAASESGGPGRPSSN